jgi:ssDNA-binding Zn-finger/Zn-ribbon topoisomerase 1
MSIFDKIFSKSESSGGGNTPKFVSKDRTGGNTYEVYKGSDPESAKAFLATKTVTEAQYYIVVETPDGNWGLDKEGLFLEKLLPWQTDVGSAECDGTLGSYNLFGLQGAARGWNDNFVVGVTCGKCQHEWKDGIRYNNLTLVRCPQCKAKNKVDSRNIQVHFV